MFVSIALVDNTTVVKVWKEAAATNLIQALYFNKPQNYLLEGGNQALVFPCNDELTILGIRYDKLTTATATALGNPASQVALADAIANAEFFSAYNAA